MLNIQALKIYFLVFIFLVSAFVVYAAYPVDSSGACSGNLPAVKMGEWCYDCNKDVSDGVCPNDFTAPDITCAAGTDIDCATDSLCSQQLDENFCKADADGCTWCYACENNNNVGPARSQGPIQNHQIKDACIDNTQQCEYHCISGVCGAKCSEWESGTVYEVNPQTGICEQKEWSCSSSCTRAPTVVGVSSCNSLYTNLCDDGTGKTDACGRSCARTPPSPYTSSKNEAIVANWCNDGNDNDCNGQWDYDTLDRGPTGNIPPKGDSNCAVGVTGISVSQSNVPKGSNFEVTCTTTVSQINSVDAYVANQKCNYVENSWSGNNVKFLCSTNALSTGSQTVKCAIDTTKSYAVQQGAEKTATVNIIVSGCSQYADQTSCNNDPNNRCSWCEKCSGNLWSGGDNRCVDKNTCSYQLKANQCNAVCDATVGCTAVTDCDTLDKCYQGTYRDYEDLKQWCDFNNGQCKESSCTVFKEIITDADKDGYDTQCDNDCNDNNLNINPGTKEICDGIDNDCNPATADGSGDIAPNNDKQQGICAGTKKICAGANGWQNNYPNGYEDGTELTCSDNKDNDCNGLADCIDAVCAKKAGPNGLTCCQSKELDCPADGAEGFVGCVNDNTKKGAVGSFTCLQNECKSSTIETTSSCNTNCCLPGGGTATCVNSGKSSVIDVDSDQRTEVCSAGNWIGANCQGNNCNDDGSAPHPNYNCATIADCKGDIGQCGEEICSSNVCSAQEKTNKKQICESLMPASYQCAKFFSCSTSTNYNCQYAGDSILCADKYPVAAGRNPYDTACSGNPTFKCNVDVCISEAVTTNPCCLCYSQCIGAANDPIVAPETTSECNIAKNYQWTNAQCPFSGGS